MRYKRTRLFCSGGGGASAATTAATTAAGLVSIIGTGFFFLALRAASSGFGCRRELRCGLPLCIGCDTEVCALRSSWLIRMRIDWEMCGV